MNTTPENKYTKIGEKSENKCRQSKYSVIGCSLTNNVETEFVTVYCCT